MRVVEIVRDELNRHGLAFKLPIEDRRRLVDVAKRAQRQGSNPRAEVSRILSKVK